MNDKYYKIIIVCNNYEAIAIILEKGYNFSGEQIFCCNGEGLQEAGPVGPAHAKTVELMSMCAW